MQLKFNNVEASGENQALAGCLDTNGPAAPSAVKEHLSGSEEDFDGESEVEEYFVLARSAPFQILRCEGEDLRFVRDEKRTF